MYWMLLPMDARQTLRVDSRQPSRTAGLSNALRELRSLVLRLLGSARR
jgi:hypothetical protein